MRNRNMLSGQVRQDITQGKTMKHIVKRIMMLFITLLLAMPGYAFAEKLDTDVTEETVTAVSEGFSIYTVEFTYGNLQYELNGGTESLSRILEGLGLVGVVTEVEVSDSELFDAVPGGHGEWIIEPKQPFSSEESMKVVIGGQEFTIAVTFN